MSIDDLNEKINPSHNHGNLGGVRITQRIKQYIDSDNGRDVLVIIIIILVGVGAFELGRLSNTDGSSGLKIEYSNDEKANAIKSVENINYLNLEKQVKIKNFFASKKGSKYYSLSCSGGKTIKEENRVYFDTREEAEGAGYELSNSCR